MANNKSELAARLTAEAVRYLEQEDEPLAGSEQVERAMVGRGGSVEQRIIERARQLAVDADVGPGLQRVQHYARLLVYGALALAWVLGNLAALQAFDQGNAVVNFYWLLLVLLGFNLASLVLWLLSFWASRSSAAGVLGQSGGYLVRRWIAMTARTGANDAQLANAWLGVMLNGAPGRWTLGSLSHALWAGYLLGGLGMILMLLAARQYDFVWETTLLGEATFVSLTQALSVLPAHLGLPTPSLEHISGSRLGADPALLAAARQAWAGLLISSLLLYGLLPRIALYLFCRLRQARALAAFRLDTSRPYYVRLRQRLIPPATHLGVVDADDVPPQTNPESPLPGGAQAIPAEAHWLGIELGPEEPWPPVALPPPQDLGSVADRLGQHRALDQVAILGRKPLVLAVPLQRSPDRGLARFIAQLLGAHSGSSWLALLENRAATAAAATRDARLCDWYALAASSGIEADHIAQVLVGAPGNEVDHG